MQPVRDGEVLPRGAGHRHQAGDRRRPVAARIRRARAAQPADAAVPERGRLPESLQAGQPRLPGGERQATPLIERDWLTGEALGGLIALSGAWEGDVGRALLNGRPALARRNLQHWQSLLGDRYYVELQRLGRSFDAEYVTAAVALAAEAGVPVVATNDVRFLQAADYEAHEARVCIRERAMLADPARKRRY